MTDRDREALVLACKNARFGDLKFLPEVGDELFKLLTSPEHGNCVFDDSVLKHEPNRDEIETLFFAAFQGAAKRSRDLIIYFIGHGHCVDSSFYLVCADSDGAKNLADVGDIIKRSFSCVPYMRGGLTIVLDVCFAGGIAGEIMERLLNRLPVACMAAVADGHAYDGCFSQSLIQIAREGTDSTSDETLGCAKLRTEISKRCKKQLEPVVNYSLIRGDVPYVTYNLRPSGGLSGRPLPVYFQPTSALLRIVRASERKEIVRIIGNRGTGKTTLARALAEPNGIEGFVPRQFVDAVAFLSSNVTPGELTRHLSRQLAAFNPDFAESQRSFEADPNYTEREKEAMAPLERRIVRPAERLAAGTSVRIVLSGLHTLKGGINGENILRSLRRLAKIRGIRLVLFSERSEGLPGAAPFEIMLGWAESDELSAYLKALDLDPQIQADILAKSGRNWEFAVQLAEVARSRPADLPETLPDIYNAMVEDRELRKEHWCLLGVLAAAVGNNLPFRLLHAALEQLGGSSTPEDVRALLSQTGRFAGPDSNADQVGLSVPATASLTKKRVSPPPT